MKSTDNFKQAIKKYLDERAQEDELFAVSYNKENKNIDDCCTYILNQVKESGCNGFDDDEIFSMAVHYYDEDNIEVGKMPSNMKMVINHQVELTDEEKQKAHDIAFKQAQEEAYKALTKRPKNKKAESNIQQGSLFD